MNYRPGFLERAWVFGALVLAVAQAPVFPAIQPVTIQVASRAVAPGELLRIVVTSDVPLASLEGRFLGEPVRLQPSPGGKWSGWAMIGLLQQPGPASLEIHGKTTDGIDAAGTRALTIDDRPFPTEELSVAPKFVEPPPEVRERLARERKLLAGLYRELSPFPANREPFVRPVPGQSTSIFGTRRVFNGRPRDPHSGLDLRAATGSPVKASGPGRVVLARDLYYSGNTVLIDHGGGLFTIYAHLSEFRVEEGQPAVAGQIIALSGATGRVTGPHLHWGAKIADRPFDPTALLDPALWSGTSPD
jgi:murein DD-endopeptidase MepM/ murein hydrolase activator NlpD